MRRRKAFGRRNPGRRECENTSAAQEAFRRAFGDMLRAGYTTSPAEQAKIQAMLREEFPGAYEDNGTLPSPNSTNKGFLK